MARPRCLGLLGSTTGRLVLESQTIIIVSVIFPPLLTLKGVVAMQVLPQGLCAEVAAQEVVEACHAGLDVLIYQFASRQPLVLVAKNLTNVSLRLLSLLSLSSWFSESKQPIPLSLGTGGDDTHIQTFALSPLSETFLGRLLTRQYLAHQIQGSIHTYTVWFRLSKKISWC